MPSDKKRINLTVSEDLYGLLQEYKKRYGIANDASACIQLITQQLHGQKQMDLMLQILNTTSMDQLLEMSRQGLTYAKEELAPALLAAQSPEKTDK